MHTMHISTHFAGLCQPTTVERELMTQFRTLREVTLIGRFLDAPVSSTGQAYQVRHDGIHRHPARLSEYHPRQKSLTSNVAKIRRSSVAVEPACRVTRADKEWVASSHVGCLTYWTGQTTGFAHRIVLPPLLLPFGFQSCTGFPPRGG